MNKKDYEYLDGIKEGILERSQQGWRYKRICDFYIERFNAIDEMIIAKYICRILRENNRNVSESQAQSTIDQYWDKKYHCQDDKDFLISDLSQLTLKTSISL